MYPCIVTMGIPSLHLVGENINYTVVKGNIDIWPRFLLQWTFITIKSSIVEHLWSEQIEDRKWFELPKSWLLVISAEQLELILNLPTKNLQCDALIYKCINLKTPTTYHCCQSILPGYLTRHNFLSSLRDIGQQPVIYYILFQH